MGDVYIGSRYGGNVIGHVDTDGDVYVGSRYGGDRIGYVDTDGDVYSGPRYGGDRIGYSAAPRVLAGGATILLLLR